MTQEEIDLAEKLNHCTFLPGSFDKRFVRAMGRYAKHQPARELSPKQRDLLVKMRHRYRRQLGEAT